jgi:hypothetical protein
MHQNHPNHTVIASLRQSVLFLLFFFLLTLCSDTAQGEDWSYFAKYKDNFYYDRESITYPLAPYKGTISLWQKIVYDKDSSFSMAERLGGKYSDVFESLHLIELNCRSKQVQVKSISFYDSKGTIIEYSYKEREQWKPIAPDTPFEDLYWRVCPKSDRD